MDCRRWQKKTQNHCCFLFYYYYCYLHVFPQQPPLSKFFSVSMAGTHCRPQLHVLAVKHSVSQLVRGIMATVELHCLRDNAWLTWSTSEPDILLSLHHNTTTQTDMAGPLISRAGLTDLLCAHCNGCMVSSNVPRIRWRDQNTNMQFSAFLLEMFCHRYIGRLVLKSDDWIVGLAFVSLFCYNYSKRRWILNYGRV